MRLPNLKGQIIGVRWRDPNGGRMECKNLVKGWKALATWVEVGTVIDQSEGVLMLAQSVGINEDSPTMEPDEVQRAVVPISLIEEIAILRRVKTIKFKRP